MNQTFDIHRFALMLRFDAAEKGKNYLMMAGVLVFCLLAMLLPITMTNEYSEFRRILHFMALFMIALFGSSLYTSNALSQYSSPDTGIASLMIPASRVEKFLSSLLLNLAFVLPFLLLFWQLHYRTVDHANTLLPPGANPYQYIPKDFADYTIYAYILIHAVVFCGSVYFKKFAYIKTAAIGIAFVAVLSYFNYILSMQFASRPSMLTVYPLTGWKTWFNVEDGMSRPRYMAGFYHITLSEPMLHAVQAFTVAVAVMIWLAAYYRLKEREI